MDFRTRKARTETTTATTSVSSSEDFMWATEGAAHAGAAKRRRERRHRENLKYERMSVAIALSEHKHHTSRGQMMDWERAALHGHVPEHPTHQAAGTEYFALDVEDVPAAGSRRDRLAGVRPQERVKRHTVEHTVDFVRVAPVVQFLDAPVPLMVEQLPDVMHFFDTLMPDPEQVIEVPKILPDDVPMRTADTQLSTFVSFSLLQRILEQNVDIPVLGGGGRLAGLQGFLPGQSSTAPTVAQIVANPAPGGGLQGFRTGQSSSSSSHSPAGVHGDLDELGEDFSFFPIFFETMRSWVHTRGRN